MWLNKCPRCSGALVFNEYFQPPAEVSCLACGYVAYVDPPEKAYKPWPTGEEAHKDGIAQASALRSAALQKRIREYRRLRKLGVSKEMAASAVGMKLRTAARYAAGRQEGTI